jgi:hypothetical protein
LFPWAIPSVEGPTPLNFQVELGYRTVINTSIPTLELWFADECGIEGDPRPAAALERSGQPAKRTLSWRPYPCQCHWRCVPGYRGMLHDVLKAL